VHLVTISHTQARDNPSVSYAAVIHNGVDLDSFPFSGDKSDYVAYVGRVSPEKGTHLAVEVARRAGLHLKMAVKRWVEDAEWAYWEQMVAPLLTGDEEIVEQPPQDQKWDILAHARATPFPIDWDEPFGLVMIESMACGTPVVTRALGAAPEVVVEGVTGFLRHDIESMVRTVDLATDLDPRDCRHLVEARLSSVTMVDCYERLYRQLVRKAARAPLSVERGASPLRRQRPNLPATGRPDSGSNWDEELNRLPGPGCAFGAARRPPSAPVDWLAHSGWRSALEGG